MCLHCQQSPVLPQLALDSLVLAGIPAETAWLGYFIHACRARTLLLRRQKGLGSARTRSLAFPPSGPI